MMNVISGAMDVEPIALTLTLQDPPASVITLYDLIAAIQDAVGGDDDDLVVATLRHILESRTATWLSSMN